MVKDTLDIVICGSSRPKLLPYCIESIKRFIISQSQSTEFRIIVHEDFVDEEKSKEVIEWCEKNNIDEVIKTNPASGYGKGLYKVLNEYVTSDYILNMQDDWEFERTGIDIDRVLWTMRKNDIWSIIFNKLKNSTYKKDHFNKEVDFDGMKLILSNCWRVIPSVWKTSIAKEKWENWNTGPAGKFINKFGKREERKNIHYAEEKVRSYYYGGLLEPRFVRHIGNTWRSSNTWRSKGCCIEWDITTLRDKPPWIPFIIRPMNKHWCTDKEKEKDRYKKIMEILNSFPEEIRKEFLE